MKKTNENQEARSIEVFTTRPDTIFGVTFMTLAPEHELVPLITSAEQKSAVEAYVEKTAKRSERERMADVKTISGVFTGAFAEHPFTKEPIPVWIGDYVLAGYGTGAVMAVPCGDERDYAFAKHFNIPIKNIFANADISQEAYSSKDNVTIANSDFLNGLDYKEATKKAIAELEKIGHGKGKTNYRLRDAVFSRQRYWGEPFPVYYVNGMPQMIDAQYLPIVLPEVEKYLPTEDGQPPLGNATDWAWNSLTHQVVSNELIDGQIVFPLELNTMPGWAGSSWYWMRYMDAHNETEFASREALNYWQNVDLYIGGSEHATGHLLYARFWNKFLHDKGFAPTEEPFKKLINQGMILGMSAFVFRLSNFEDLSNNLIDKIEGKIYTVEQKNKIDEFIREFNNQIFISFPIIENHPFIDMINKGSGNVYTSYTEINELLKKLLQKYSDIIDSIGFTVTRIHVDVNLVDSSNALNVQKLKSHPMYQDYANSLFLTPDEGEFYVSREVEKMSKSKYNVVTPDDICAEYGADTLRLYEMFLGPLEQAKPWNTAGITGVFGFLKKLWRLYFDESGWIVTDSEPSKDSLKTLHKTIKKAQEDIEGFSFNTSVSQFMICVNELSAQNCHERAILEPLSVLISPYAPHIAEELWFQLGNKESISTADFPVFDQKHLIESSKEYPVSFNGKTRFTLELPLNLSAAQIEEIVMKDERTLKQLDGSTPNKVIIVPGKIINIVG